MNKRQRKKVSTSKLTPEEKATKERISRLKYRVQREINTANARIDRLAKADMLKSSNAYRYLERLEFDKKTEKKQKRYDFLKIKNDKVKFKIDLRHASWNELEKVNAFLEDFLNAKTSTVRGVKEKYTKAYKSYIKGTGETITEADYAEMFVSGLFEQYTRLYSSGQAQEFFKKARENGFTTEELREIIGNTATEETPHREMLQALIQAKEDKEKLEKQVNENSENKLDKEL